MNMASRNEILKDIEITMKPVLKDLYLKWRNVQSSEVSELFFYWVFKHRHEKTMALISKRHHRKLKVKKLKEQLQDMVLKNEFEEFEKNL